jgi:hypothetical protein
MLRKDYLLRQIEMLSAMIGRLLQLRQAGDEQGAVEEIEQSYHDLFGLDPRLISLLPTEMLVSKLKSGEYIDATKGITLAILLREDATNYLAQGNVSEHYQRLLRSLQVYLATILEQELIPEHESLYSVDDVLDQMLDYELPPDAKFSLFQYYEDTGQFARAEDTLHELLDIPDVRQTVLAEGKSFYEWLLTLNDEELEAGNLPRLEVQESLAQLQALGT